MSIDEATLGRLRELAEAGKQGGWQEVVAGLDMGDIILTIRQEGERGAMKAAQQATGMGRTTLWRRATLAEHRELIEETRPANLTEALRLVQKLKAGNRADAGDEGEAGEAPPPNRGGRPKRDPLEALKERLHSTVATIAQKALMREEDLVLAVRGAYRAGVGVKAEYEAASRDQEETEAAAESKGPADVIPLAQRKRSRAKLEVVEGGAALEPALAAVPAEPAATSPDDGSSTRETGAPTNPPVRGAMSVERTVVLEEPKGEPVTFIMNSPHYGVRVIECKAASLAIEKRSRGESVSMDFFERRNAKAWKTKTTSMAPSTAEVPLAVLRGHGIGVAAVSQLGWGPIGEDKHTGWPELVSRARSCGAEILVDRLGGASRNGSTVETGGSAGAVA